VKGNSRRDRNVQEENVCAKFFVQTVPPQRQRALEPKIAEHPSRSSSSISRREKTPSFGPISSLQEHAAYDASAFPNENLKIAVSTFLRPDHGNSNQPAEFVAPDVARMRTVNLLVYRHECDACMFNVQATSIVKYCNATDLPGPPRT
jgi:hypothetical protein